MRRPVPDCLPVLAVGVHKSAVAGALQGAVIFPATLPGKLDEERHIQAGPAGNQQRALKHTAHAPLQVSDRKATGSCAR